MNNYEKKNIIVISGPTASGKTKAAVKACEDIDGEIISADSRQVYRYLDTGTNKEGKLQKNGLRKIEAIAQHLTDIINPDEKYSAAEFVKDAEKAIDDIDSRGKIPVIVGGTGLYIKALLYGLDEMPPADEELRKELGEQSAENLYKRLLKLDPESAEKNKLNPQRLLRALEINILSGKTMQEHIKPKKPKYEFKHFSLSASSETLYERINKRCIDMLDNGMIEETKKVLDMGYAKNCHGLSGIGYRHIVKFLEGEIQKDELISEFCKDTRHYAKRQNTWFKAQPDIKFII